MPHEAPLRPATAAEIADTLAFALRFDGRRQHRKADGLMAEIVTDHLFKHLERSGFVLCGGRSGIVRPLSTGGMVLRSLPFVASNCGAPMAKSRPPDKRTDAIRAH